jgi:translation initiation factor 4A
MSKVNRFKLTNEEDVDNEMHINEESYDEINSWDDLDIKPELLRGIYSHGFEYPSPIQKKAIKPIIDGRDVIAQAQSGTGKTATFAISSLQLIDITNDNTQVLILSPTRELAMQSCKVIEQLGVMMPDLRVQAQYGGVVNNETSIFNSKNNPHIICG